MVINKRIILIGPMGAGKTSVGLELARLTGMAFIDTDQLLELRMQATAKQIINQYGEDFFRLKEAEILTESCKLDDVIIATGGGCILMERNRELFKHYGNVFYLLVKPSKQLQRLSTCIERGLLPNDHHQREAFFQNMAMLRNHLYDSVANAKIDTDNQGILHVTQQIVALL